MNGWLIYDSEGARRNQWFINHIIKLAEDSCASLSLVNAENLYRQSEGAKGTDICLNSGDLPDFVIVRTICPDINRFFEEKKVPCFNNYKTALIANDKWQTYLFAHKLGLPLMPTQLLSEYVAELAAEDCTRADCENDGYNHLAAFEFPIVVKSRAGHGGSEVYCLHDRAELEKFLKNNCSSQYICQPMCSEPGVDRRVYMIGGNVLAVAERRSDSDFRSNYSLGGTAAIVRPDEFQQKAALQICKELGCDFVGVDFIRHNGSWVFNEVEDVVGTRMLYKLTEIDAAERYLRHILRSIGKLK